MSSSSVSARPVGRVIFLWRAAWPAAAVGRAVGLALLVGLAVLVAGCDQAAGPGSEPRGAAEGPTRLDSASVSFSPMPTGTSLPDPAEAGPGAGIVRPGEDEETGGGGPATRAGNTRAGNTRAGNTRAGNEAAAASPYGCYLASRPFTEEVRFRSVYLRFPAEVVKAAGAETERFTYELRAAPRGEADPTGVRGPLTGVRYAHCVIPEAPGARALALGQVLEIGKEEAALEATEPTGSGAETAAGAPGGGATGGGATRGGATRGGATRGGATRGGAATRTGDCTTTVVFEEVCSGGDCDLEQIIVTSCEDTPSGGGGGGGGGGPTAPYPGDQPGDPPDDPCMEPSPEPGDVCVPAPDLPDVPEDPCDSTATNPPAYCDEAGSCFDRNISDENDRDIIRGLEDNGELNELWKKSNPNASDQSQREERGGWIVSTDGGYDLVEFHEVENDITYTPIGIKGIDSENRPSGTVATFHTHPFEPGETIKDAEVIRQLMEASDNYDPSNYDISKLAETGAVSYPSEPSVNDFRSAKNFQGYLIDGGTVYSYDGINKIEGAIDRCGY